MHKAVVLETKNLILERLSIKHLSAIYVNWMNDPDVILYLDSGGDYTINKLKYFLVEVEKKDIFFWAILTREGRKHIGNIKIDPINWKTESGEYGILLGDKAEWGKGLAYEASKVVIDYCFNNLKLKKITLGVIANNCSAINLYKRLGFVQEGYHKMYAKYYGKYCDLIRMTLFNNEDYHVVEYFRNNSNQKKNI